ncbi:hypothetical protein D9O40_00835 [Clostridium autoethanogenum]|uniref:Morphogenetic protein n=1 Tax=Clostridium autoethanogenum TaxID=84023 RepID=A0A3M0T2R3_9CLOT|nr:hypothetical protein [Clostridium autoethanogenum]RMD04926.1 hypothetical protein D9O40_00835 [Clostridium autoethanogenum]
MNLTTEKPILFNTEMVQAILQGRKASTRRIIKPQPKYALRQRNIDKGTNDWNEYGNKIDEVTGSNWGTGRICRYKPGDILYVRETWANTWTPDGEEGFVYRADGEPPEFPYWGNEKQCKDEVWIPSIHMPKIAARIFLKVTDIKAQRLQDITEDEAKAEGITEKASYDEYTQKFFNSDNDNYKYGFGKLWNSCGYKWPSSWSGNPWVWVIEFQRSENSGK